MSLCKNFIKKEQSVRNQMRNNTNIDSVDFKSLTSPLNLWHNAATLFLSILFVNVKSIDKIADKNVITNLSN
jgi:hypothetical protein